MRSTFCPVSASIDHYLLDLDQDQAEQEADWDPELASLYDSEPVMEDITLDEWEAREEAHETTVDDLAQVEAEAMRRAA